MVEKPPLADAPSDLAIIGRYIFTPDIFGAIEQTKPGAGGEIQITDAMRLLLDERPFYAVKLEGTPRRRRQTRFSDRHRRVRPKTRRPRREFREYLKIIAVCRITGGPFRL